MNKLFEIYNFRSINEQLSCSGQPDEDQLEMLAENAYEVIINLAPHVLEDEPGLISRLGMIYVHIPVPFDAPTEHDLMRFFEAMDEHQGRKLHIHCAANKRATAFLGLYFIINFEWSETDAFKPMNSIWESNPIWSAFIEETLGRQ